MKGIILAGGSGSRLYPMTAATNKLLLPIYDKPMIYYPLSTLMLAGIRDILLISAPNDLENFRRLMGDGSRYGIHMSYTVQPRPEGIAHAFILGEEFVRDDRCALILGDNIFYGRGLDKLLRQAVEQEEGAVVFGRCVSNPEQFGVVDFDSDGRAVSIEEKPEAPKSNCAVTGLYFYDKYACKWARTLKPSARGELEITDLNRLYLNKGKLKVITLGKGLSWFDAGTVDSMHDAANFIRDEECGSGVKTAVPEEIGYRSGWLTRAELEAGARRHESSHYGRYLSHILEDRCVRGDITYHPCHRDAGRNQEIKAGLLYEKGNSKTNL